MTRYPDRLHPQKAGLEVEHVGDHVRLVVRNVRVGNFGMAVELSPTVAAELAADLLSTNPG